MINKKIKNGIKKLGFISIEYVLIGCILAAFGAYSVPKVLNLGNTAINDQMNNVNNYEYDAEPSDDRVTIVDNTGQSTDTTTPDEGTTEVDNPYNPPVIDEEDRDPNQPTGIYIYTDGDQAIYGGMLPKINDTMTDVNITLHVGDRIYVKGKIYPANATNQNIRYINYNSEVAVANQNGLITALMPGEAMIRLEAAQNGIFNTINIKVEHYYPTSIKLNPDKISMNVGEIKDIMVEFEPSSTTFRQCTFTSSDNTIATVTRSDDTSASIKALKADKTKNIDAVVTAKCVSDDSGSFVSKDVELEITELMTATESIKFTTPEDRIITLEVGDTFATAYKITPTDATVQQVSYESDNPSVAAISNNGVITAQSVGSTNVYINNYGGDYYGAKVYDTIKVIVEPKTIPLQSLSIKYTQDSIMAGRTISPIVTFNPSNTTETDLVWTVSNDTIAHINTTTGQVQGKEKGSVTITATSKNHSSIKATTALSITGSTVAVTGITLSEHNATIGVGNSKTVSYTIAPSNATVKTATWTSSDPSIATVENGVIYGVSQGTCIITVTSIDGGFKDTINVAVTAIPVSSIEINPASANMIVGDQIAVNATVYPVNATDKDIKWEILDSNGQYPLDGVISLGSYKNKETTVFAENPGTVTLRARATSNNVYKDITIKVRAVYAERIELTPTSLELAKGTPSFISAKVFPENAVHTNVEWSSSDTSIVIVDTNGRIQASSTKVGTAKIIATWKYDDPVMGTHNEVSASATVKVKEIEPDVIEFANSSYLMKDTEGKNIINTYVTIYPINTDFKNVEFRACEIQGEECVDTDVFEFVDKGPSGDGIKRNLQLIGKNIGNAVITATVKGNERVASGEAQVTVTSGEIPVTGIEFTGSSPITMTIGDTLNIANKVKINPETATNKGLEYSVDDSAIATISKDGTITAVSIGTTRIMIKSKSSQLWIKVDLVVEGVKLTQIRTSPDTATLERTKKIDFTVSFFPESASNKTFIYTILDENKNPVYYYDDEGQFHITVPTLPLMVDIETDSEGRYLPHGKIQGIDLGKYYVRFTSNENKNVFYDMPIEVTPGILWDGTQATALNIKKDTEGNKTVCHVRDGWELAWVSYHTNIGDIKSKHNCDIIKQDREVDLNNKVFTPIGINDSNPFSIVYDGNNQVIKNLYVTGADINNVNTSCLNYGLFGNATGTIKNLTVTDANINYDATYNLAHSPVYIGVLAGKANLINDIYLSKGNIKITQSSAKEQVYSGSVVGKLGS